MAFAERYMEVLEACRRSATALMLRAAYPRLCTGLGIPLKYRFNHSRVLATRTEQ